MHENAEPGIDFEKVATELGNTLKEVGYMAVGLGVLGFQRAQVERVGLIKQLDRIEETLPDPARELVQSVREAVGLS